MFQEAEKTPENPNRKVIEFEGAECPEIILDGRLNISEEKVLEHMEHSIRLGLPQFKPHMPTKEPIMVASGGPSLKKYIKSIKRRRDRGVPIVTMNGTHDYLLDNDVKPSMHVMIDGRPFNKRFVERAINECVYFISSQCHQSVFEALEGKRVYIFHTNCSDAGQKLLEDYYKKQFVTVVGGSTVNLRTICLLAMLGRPNQEHYGFDSCYLNGKHHSYDQSENDGDNLVTIIPDLHGHGHKKFVCAPWMVAQAKELQDMIATVGDKFQLAVYGPGLISHILKTGAKIGD